MHSIRAAFINRSDQAQDQGQHHKHDGDPLGHLGQLGVPGLGLVLGQEGVHAAGNGAGQARALAGLEHDHGDQDQAAQKLNDGEGELHINIVPFRPVQTGEKSKIDCNGIFVAVGRIPNTELVKGQIELDREGYIIAGEDTKTNIPGVFAAGDVRQKPLRQIVTAASDGAVASKFVEEYMGLLP